MQRNEQKFRCERAQVRLIGGKRENSWTLLSSSSAAGTEHVSVCLVMLCSPQCTIRPDAWRRVIYWFMNKNRTTNGWTWFDPCLGFIKSEFYRQDDLRGRRSAVYVHKLTSAQVPHLAACRVPSRGSCSVIDQTSSTPVTPEGEESDSSSCSDLQLEGRFKALALGDTDLVLRLKNVASHQGHWGYRGGGAVIGQHGLPVIYLTSRD